MTLMRECPAIRHVARLPPPFWILTVTRISSSLSLLALSLFLIVLTINVIIVIVKVFGFIIIVNIITRRNYQCQGCNKYLIFDECQPLLFHRPNVQNVWKYCSEDWMSYKTADSRRFIERTFLDKVEHIHQKLFNRFYISFFSKYYLNPYHVLFNRVFFLFWHGDGYHKKEKSFEE